MTKMRDSPSIIKVSIGSAIHLGLTSGIMDAIPTTAYLLTYIEGRCAANCTFCAQARESSSRGDMLSRVVWPPYPLSEVVDAIGRSWRKGELQRTCIQTVNHPTVFQETLAIVKAIRVAASLPVSVSCMPFNRSEMEKLREAGVERVGIPLDAATKELFDKVKGRVAGGPYRWDLHLQALRDAVVVFGRGSVNTHLMVGLGESDRDLLGAVQTVMDIGVYPALFAFTPIVGSNLERMPQPNIRRYHRIQLAHNLITKGFSTFDRMVFDAAGYLTSFGVDDGLLREVAGSGLPFVTSGCPGCNRPYYNERPGGKLYNYPSRPSAEETDRILQDILEEK